MDPQSFIALASLVVAVPSAWISYRDLTGVRPHRRTQPAQYTWPPPGHGPVGTRVQRTASVSGAVERLSLPRRFLSTFVDVYAVMLIGIGIAAVLSGGEERASEDLVAADWIGIAIAWIGLAWMSSYSGRSPGRLLVGGRLVPKDDPTGRVPFGTVVVRSLIAVVLNAFFYLSLFAGLTSPTRQTLHDRIVSTRVIKTR